MNATTHEQTIAQGIGSGKFGVRVRWLEAMGGPPPRRFRWEAIEAVERIGRPGDSRGAIRSDARPFANFCRECSGLGGVR
jgi:hypothetical protein